ncbi:uncharacterized protein SCODWIG_01643 [Saccharomycodes ludwigii]|uniref:F-box domain-containing protein n=1 Tax=Saccharomycodes ludwigii TaxID=36035 RepID=A0A376B5I2_9ASCO|nr:hypothetical protein SCDLUD_002002 [Saccharomycodes ludwigii]KAH3902187.1 hypothetical protein SCDLUD_002002 [Saccharomycodes ludwigii]SSD59882.1 uncharacterized protein SCODWIG_01643 [Saccharomycodes ludwigii]
MTETVLRLVPNVTNNDSLSTVKPEATVTTNVIGEGVREKDTSEQKHGVNNLEGENTNKTEPELSTTTTISCNPCNLSTIHSSTHKPLFKLKSNETTITNSTLQVKNCSTNLDTSSLLTTATNTTADSSIKSKNPSNKKFFFSKLQNNNNNATANKNEDTFSLFSLKSSSSGHHDNNKNNDNGGTGILHLKKFSLRYQRKKIVEKVSYKDINQLPVELISKILLYVLNVDQNQDDAYKTVVGCLYVCKKFYYASKMVLYLNINLKSTYRVAQLVTSLRSHPDNGKLVRVIDFSNLQNGEIKISPAPSTNKNNNTNNASAESSSSCPSQDSTNLAYAGWRDWRLRNDPLYNPNKLTTVSSTSNTNGAGNNLSIRRTRTNSIASSIYSKQSAMSTSTNLTQVSTSSSMNSTNSFTGAGNTVSGPIANSTATATNSHMRKKRSNTVSTLMRFDANNSNASVNIGSGNASNNGDVITKNYTTKSSINRKKSNSLDNTSRSFLQMFLKNNSNSNSTTASLDSSDNNVNENKRRQNPNKKKLLKSNNNITSNIKSSNNRSKKASVKNDSIPECQETVTKLNYQPFKEKHPYTNKFLHKYRLNKDLPYGYVLHLLNHCPNLVTLNLSGVSLSDDFKLVKKQQLQPYSSLCKTYSTRSLLDDEERVQPIYFSDTGYHHNVHQLNLEKLTVLDIFQVLGNKLSFLQQIIMRDCLWLQEQNVKYLILTHCREIAKDLTTVNSTDTHFYYNFMHSGMSKDSNWGTKGSLYDFLILLGLNQVYHMDDIDLENVFNLKKPIFLLPTENCIAESGYIELGLGIKCKIVLFQNDDTKYNFKLEEETDDNGNKIFTIECTLQDYIGDLNAERPDYINGHNGRDKNSNITGNTIKIVRQIYNKIQYLRNLHTRYNIGYNMLWPLQY